MVDKQLTRVSEHSRDKQNSRLNRYSKIKGEKFGGGGGGHNSEMREVNRLEQG